MSTPDASYEVVAHERARGEIEDAPDETRDRIVDAIHEMAGLRQPDQHNRAKYASGRDGILRVKVGTYRAIVALDKPQLRLLLVDHRDTVYDKLDVAERRRSE